MDVKFSKNNLLKSNKMVINCISLDVVKDFKAVFGINERKTKLKSILLGHSAISDF